MIRYFIAHRVVMVYYLEIGAYVYTHYHLSKELREGINMVLLRYVAVRNFSSLSLSLALALSHCFFPSFN